MTDHDHATRVQPAPVAGEGPAIWEKVLNELRWCPSLKGTRERLANDIQARDAIGRQKYGQPLRPHNNRDQLADAYQEAIDLVGYSACAVAEWDEVEADGRSFLAGIYTRALALALDIRRAIDRRDAGEWGPGSGAEAEAKVEAREEGS